MYLEDPKLRKQPFVTAIKQQEKDAVLNISVVSDEDVGISENPSSVKKDLQSSETIDCLQVSTENGFLVKTPVSHGSQSQSAHMGYWHCDVIGSQFLLMK